MYLSLHLANGVNYLQLPIGVKVRSMTAVADATPGATASVTLAQGANSVNVATFDGVAVGVAVTGTPDATYGKVTYAAGTALKITTSSTNSVTFKVVLDLDEFLVVA